MIELNPAQAQQLHGWFVPDRPGPSVGLHVLHTGHGLCLVDRWPNPGVVLAECGGNYELRGSPSAVDPRELAAHIAGFVATSPDWVPLLRTSFPDMLAWDRLIFDLQAAPGHTQHPGAVVRRLDAADSDQLSALSDELAWISKTWGGPAGLLVGETAWGAFVADRLAALACSFFVGDEYEDIGIVTEAAFRGQGLGPACAGAACAAIRARGRRPSWTTSPDNMASIRVAQKLGFTLQRQDYLYVIGTSIPAPARSDP